MKIQLTVEFGSALSVRLRYPCFRTTSLEVLIMED